MVTVTETLFQCWFSKARTISYCGFLFTQRVEKYSAGLFCCAFGGGTTTSYCCYVYTLVSTPCSLCPDSTLRGHNLCVGNSRGPEGEAFEYGTEIEVTSLLVTHRLDRWLPCRREVYSSTPHSPYAGIRTIFPPVESSLVKDTSLVKKGNLYQNLI